jgi:hypothetical protein
MLVLVEGRVVVEGALGRGIGDGTGLSFVLPESQLESTVLVGRVGNGTAAAAEGGRNGAETGAKVFRIMLGRAVVGKVPSVFPTKIGATLGATKAMGRGTGATVSSGSTAAATISAAWHEEGGSTDQVQIVAAIHVV